MLDIRKSMEFQIVDEIRRKLHISESSLEAPYYEVDAKTNDYIRHCRLIVKRNISRPLYLGLDMQHQLIEVYFTNCLCVVDDVVQRDPLHNWVYSRASLHDKTQLTGVALRNLIKMAAARAGSKIKSGGPFEEPIVKRAVVYPTIGPYVAEVHRVLI